MFLFGNILVRQFAVGTLFLVELTLVVLESFCGYKNHAEKIRLT